MNKLGSTAAHKSFVIDTWLGGDSPGARYGGRDVRTGREVHFSILEPRLRVPFEEIERRVRYDIEGVAPLCYLGRLDEDSSLALVEEVPFGTPLVKRELESSDRSLVARGIAEIVARANARGMVLVGIRPELVFLGENLTTRVMPRFPVLMASYEYRRGTSSPSMRVPYFPNEEPYVDPATILAHAATPAWDVYAWGLVTSWLFDRRHPFAESAAANQDSWLDSMQMGLRSPFTGPPELDRILARALDPDPVKRPSIDEILASAW